MLAKTFAQGGAVALLLAVLYVAAPARAQTSDAAPDTTRYDPAVIWNDISYPEKGEALDIIADYFNERPDGVVNDRWNAKWWESGRPGAQIATFATQEYAEDFTLWERKWEATRGLGKSFGYNRRTTAAQMLSVNELVDSFADVVSKGGNFLLDVGSKADGTIPEVQVKRLRGLGAWLDKNGEAIFGTRPWVEAERTLAGADSATVRFTRKGDVVYAILLAAPQDETSVQIERLFVPNGARVALLATGEALDWEQRDPRVAVELPPLLPEAPAHVLKIAPQPHRLMQEEEAP